MTLKSLSQFTAYGSHCLDDDDFNAVMDALKSDFLTGGSRVKLFEDKIKERVKSSYSLSCSNGTAALHLASMALGIKKGDKVIVPTITFLATANAPHLCGAQIIFADVDPETALMTPKTFQDAIDSADGKIKAVFPVHIAGHVCDMVEISRIAKKHNIVIVEDACHAFGTIYNDQPVGNCAYSDIAIFSFHPVKNIAMGEGGAITTNNPELFDKLSRYRSHGMVRQTNNNDQPWFYEMPEPGLNYRLTDIQCALGLSQLKKLDSFKQKRKKLRAKYVELLAPHSDIIKIMPTTNASDACWHLCVSLIEFDKLTIDRGELMRQLCDLNIGTQVHYIPVHTQPYYKNIKQYDLPNAMHYYDRALTLPLHMKLDEQMVKDIVENLTTILNNNKKEKIAHAV